MVDIEYYMNKSFYEKLEQLSYIDQYKQHRWQKGRASVQNAENLKFIPRSNLVSHRKLIAVAPLFAFKVYIEQTD